MAFSVPIFAMVILFHPNMSCSLTVFLSRLVVLVCRCVMAFCVPIFATMIIVIVMAIMISVVMMGVTAKHL